MDTLCSALAKTVVEYGDQPAYSDRHGDRTLTWGELRDQALDVAAALVARGLGPGETVALMASNRIEHVVADLAAVHAAATPMTVYATLAPEQVAFIAGHSTPTVVVLEGQDQLDRWALALAKTDGIRTVVVLDPAAVTDDARVVRWSDLVEESRSLDRAEVHDRAAAVRAEDPLTILYTSGTTGDPKGVVLTHANVLSEIEHSTAVSQLHRPGESISYLPFAHIAERVLGMYIPQVHGGHVHLVDDPTLLPATLGKVHPTRFFGVPRVWEKVMTGVSALLAANADDRTTAALATGLAWVEAQQDGGRPSAELEASFRQADAEVLQGIRALLGLDRVEWAASAAAPMPLEVARFFAGLGIVIHDVYGMTETTGSVTANGPAAFRLGSVGRPLPSVGVRLAEDGEILVRGPMVTPGYLRAPEATAELLDAEGWVHTGDIGRFDEDGYLFVVDRKKEMIITSTGKNIAPSNIENLLKESPLIGHAFVAGDGKPYVVALLTLDGDLAPIVAAKLGLTGLSLAELAQHPAIVSAVEAAVASANARLSRPEQVKRFSLLPDEWTAESEELTPTLKLKRRVVSAKYSDVLEGLFA